MLNPEEKRKKMQPLAHVREERRKTQPEAANYFGLGPSGRNTIGAWENGRENAPQEYRGKFIGYLCEFLDLRKDPERFNRLWAILHEQWGWESPTQYELSLYCHELEASSSLLRSEERPDDIEHPESPRSTSQGDDPISGPKASPVASTYAGTAETNEKSQDRTGSDTPSATISSETVSSNGHGTASDNQPRAVSGQEAVGEGTPHNRRLSKWISRGRRWPMAIVVVGAIFIVAGLGWLLSVQTPTIDPPLITSQTPTIDPPLITSFQPFGPTDPPVSVEQTDGGLTIAPPISYEHLWGAYRRGSQCDSIIELEARMEIPPSSGGFGYAIAPRSQIIDGQPNGLSIQLEWSKDPEGYFVREVQLPREASISTPPTRLRGTDLGQWHRVKVVATGTRNEVWIDDDDEPFVVFHGSDECGGVALRVWGATAHFRNVTYRRAQLVPEGTRMRPLASRLSK